MSDLEIWIVIGALVLATATARSSLWLIGHQLNIPRRVQNMLRYAPACALAAIIGPDLLLSPTGHVVLALSNIKLLSGIAATAYYLLRRNMLETIIFGMVCFTVIRLLAG